MVMRGEGFNGFPKLLCAEIGGADSVGCGEGDAELFPFIVRESLHGDPIFSVSPVSGIALGVEHVLTSPPRRQCRGLPQAIDGEQLHCLCARNFHCEYDVFAI